ncbi:MAG TPA: hypothetical protein VHP11_08895 [Tepidisphaeraceae bacterium]|nr:hypothetical protein [Tepidisphaeraceae bacterium]
MAALKPHLIPDRRLFKAERHFQIGSDGSRNLDQVVIHAHAQRTIIAASTIASVLVDCNGPRDRVVPAETAFHELTGLAVDADASQRQTLKGNRHQQLFNEFSVKLLPIRVWNDGHEYHAKRVPIAAYVNAFGLRLWLIKHRSTEGLATVPDGFLIGTGVGLAAVFVPPLLSLIAIHHPEEAKLLIIAGWGARVLVGGMIGAMLAAIGRKYVSRTFISNGDRAACDSF